MKFLSVEIEPFKSQGKEALSEIYQKTGIQFAFATARPADKGSAKQCHEWILCRDFLNDAALAQHVNSHKGIYGFNFYPGTNPPVDFKNMRVLVRKRERDIKLEETEQFIESALKIVNHFEVECGIKPKTKVRRVSNIEGTFLFIGSSEWMDSPFMISLYTFLIRLGTRKPVFETKEELAAKLEAISKEPHDRGDTDINYLKSTRLYLYDIITNRKKYSFVKPDGSILMSEYQIETFHNSTGIVALTNNMVPERELKYLFKKK
jgi:hypothetical protein